LRALITADLDLVPDDIWGYRTALIDAFRSRGIYPMGVSSYSEEALRWPNGGLGSIEGIRFTADANNEVAVRKFIARQMKAARRSKTEMHLRRSQRVGPQGQILQEMVIQILPQRKSGSGATLIVDDKGAVRYRISASTKPDSLLPPDPLAMATITDDAPKERRLRIFAFDPSQGIGPTNHLTVNVPFEELEPGPVG